MLSQLEANAREMRVLLGLLSHDRQGLSTDLDEEGLDDIDEGMRLTIIL